MKIPALHLQRIDVKVRHEHVARGYDRLRLTPWIRPSASCELITAAGRESELFIAICKADQVAGQVEELLGDKMNNLPFPLNPAVDRHH